MKSPKKRKARLKQNKRKTQSTQNGVGYDPLEPRQMLATDLGLNLTGATFGSETSDLISDVTGDSSADHVIQAVNGHIGIYDRNDGVRVLSSNLEDFFIDAGANLFDDLENPQVVFDADSQRWFAAAQGEGTGNWIHVAFSNTSDPTGVWQQLQFAADSTGTHYNDDLELFVGNEAIYFSTNNHFFGDVQPLADNVSLYSIPKADIFRADPTLTNMSRFEDLDPSEYGVSLQVTSTFEDSDSVNVIGKMPWEFTFLATITRSELMDTDTGAATLSDPTPINLELNPLDPFFRPARSPFQTGDEFEGGPDERLLTIDNYRISVVEANGKLMGAHTVLFDDKDDGTIDKNVVNWFEIDLATNEFIISDSRLNAPFAWAQNNIITTPGGDAFNVSMDMNDYGVVVLNYNASGNEVTDEGIDRFVSFHSSVAMSANGLNSRTTQFEPFEVIQVGLDNFINPPLPTPWTGYGTVKLDSSDPYSSFWGFQTFANTNSRWSAQLVNLLPADMNVIVEANEFQNEITVRRSATDSNLLEIEIDGVVTDVLPYAALGNVELRGYEGNDTFFLDYSNGDPVPEGGFSFNGGAGPDAIRTNSAEGVRYVVDVNQGGTYNETSTFTAVEELFGWTGDDSFVFENRDIFNVGFLAGSAHGLGGDDTFEFADTATIGDSIEGGTGYNTLSFFDRALPTQVELDGVAPNGGFVGHSIGDPIGGDQATDQFRDINNLIGGLIGGDRYSIPDNLSGATWFIDDEDSYFTVAGGRLDFSYWDFIDATNQVDTFNVLSNTVDPIRLNGLAGDDVYNFSSDAPNNTGNTDGITGVVFANGGEGENTMVVSNEGGTAADALVLAQRISGMGEIVYTAIGGTFDITMYGSAGEDIFSVHSFLPDNTLLVESRAGNDYFSIQDLSRAEVTVRGQSGDDTYAIEMIQGVSFRNLVIEDSIDAENDRVIIVGTVLDEVFTITDDTFNDLDVSYTGIESFGIEGGGGDDVFNILSNSTDLLLKGQGGNDIFNFASDAPANSGDMTQIGGNIQVDGGEGINQMNLINRGGPAIDAVINSGQITGLLANDGLIEYTATDGSFGLRESDGFGGIRLVGSELGNDVITVNGVSADHWVQLMGLGGSDQFFIRSATAANVWAGGGEGNDQYHVFIGGAARNVTAFENSSGDRNRIAYYGTNLDDVVNVREASLSSGLDRVTTEGNFQFLQVNGLDGNDSVNYDLSPALINHFLGGDGDDTMTVNGSEGIVGFRGVGNGGDDRFNLNTVDEDTFTRAIGGDGEDVFNVSADSAGKVSLDGQADSDMYNVWLMRNGERQVDTRDSGDGFDVTTVIGSDAIDAVEVRATRIITGDQRIGYGNTIDRMEIRLGNGDDTVDVFATVSPELAILTGAGEDTVLISGTTFAQTIQVFGGGGDDTMTVKKTQSTTNLELHGQGSADTFNIGSNISKDDGNLGRIRGAIVVAADNDSSVDANNDWLYINDAAATGVYSYGITPTGVQSIPGPRGIARPQFAGITFDGTLDSVRVDGTSRGNHFSVTPSPDTAMFFDGNDPNTGLASADSITLESGNGDLTITDEAMGNGYWQFSDGHQRVDFINMEVWDAGGQESPLAGNNFNGDEENDGFAPMMMAYSPTTEVAAQASALAGMQDSNVEQVDEDGSYLEKLDANVEDFDFEFDIV